VHGNRFEQELVLLVKLNWHPGGPVKRLLELIKGPGQLQYLDAITAFLKVPARHLTHSGFTRATETKDCKFYHLGVTRKGQAAAIINPGGMTGKLEAINRLGPDPRT
jgi:hypothetical protein